MEPLTTELEGLEPQTRARSNTPPLPRLVNCLENHDVSKVENGNHSLAPHMNSTCVDATEPQLDCSLLCAQLPFLESKKNSSRKKAWGDLSYADLIAQAIASVPEKRLTLSQIYEWIVQNVPHFKDKGDSTSPAGWKNSIRHNLSLHNRFLRVQNEGTGKSSWWMIDPDAKPGKSSRKRTASVETSRFGKKRGRVKKTVEELGNELAPTYATPSHGSSVSEALGTFPYSAPHSNTGFPKSPDSSSRGCSSSSSCGRLSPLLFSESEWTSLSLTSLPSDFVSEELTGNLADGVKLHLEGSFLQRGHINMCESSPPSPCRLPLENSSFRSGLAAPPYGVLPCSVHRVRGCCDGALSLGAGERLSPADPSSPCFQNEPSPHPVSRSLIPFHRQGSLLNQREQSTPSATTVQLVGALNDNRTVFDDPNLDMQAFHGGLDINVGEGARHELFTNGSLDFNFSGGQAASYYTSSHATAGTVETKCAVRLRDSEQNSTRFSQMKFVARKEIFTDG